MNESYRRLEDLVQSIEVRNFAQGDRILKQAPVFFLAKSTYALVRNIEIDETALRELVLDIVRHDYQDDAGSIERLPPFRHALVHLLDLGRMP